LSGQGDGHDLSRVDLDGHAPAVDASWNSQAFSPRLAGIKGSVPTLDKQHLKDTARHTPAYRVETVACNVKGALKAIVKATAKPIYDYSRLVIVRSQSIQLPDHTPTFFG